MVKWATGRMSGVKSKDKAGIGKKGKLFREEEWQGHRDTGTQHIKKLPIVRVLGEGSCSTVVSSSPNSLVCNLLWPFTDSLYLIKSFSYLEKSVGSAWE